MTQSNPKPKFSRIFLTCNLKAILICSAIYGAFVVGLAPFGGGAYLFSKFIASHYLAYKSEHKSFTSLYDHCDDTFMKKVGLFFYNGLCTVFIF